MSESLDTGQTSIVYLGRESFRMQVVGAGAGAGAGDGDVGAIPSAIWDGPTARIIERRNYARRHDRRSAPDAATPQPGPARQKKNMIIGISLLAFASGLALATAANRLPRSTADRIAQLELRHPATPTRAPQPPTAGAAAEMIIQPLATAAVQPPPTPAPTPAAVSAPIDEPRPAAQPAIAQGAPTQAAPTQAAGMQAARMRAAPMQAAPAIAKAAPAPRAVAARVARPRQPAHGAAVRASDLEADDPFQTPPARPRAARQWVDPFAE